MNIGIDLGSAYSMIAVKGRVDMRPGYPDPVLPRPLYIKTVDCATLIAEESTPLAVKRQIRLKKVFGDSTVRIPILLDTEEVGVIQIDDIPEQAGEGSLIVVNVEITQKNEMRGTVQVKTRSGTVAKEGAVRISFPPPHIPELSELKGLFDELKDRLEMEIMNCQYSRQRLALCGTGREIVHILSEAFAAREPDKEKAHRWLKRLNSLVNPPPDDMDPTWAEFTSYLAMCRELIAAKPDDPELKPFLLQLDRIAQQGEAAHHARAHRVWTNTNHTLRQVLFRLERAHSWRTAGVSPPEQRLPPPDVLKDHARMQIEQLRFALCTARSSGACEITCELWQKRCEGIQSELDTMDNAVQSISSDTSPDQCLEHIRLAMRKERHIKRKIRAVLIGCDTMVE
jgi:hypothetical protein